MNISRYPPVQVQKTYCNLMATKRPTRSKSRQSHPEISVLIIFHFWLRSFEARRGCARAGSFLPLRRSFTWPRRNNVRRDDEDGSRRRKGLQLRSSRNGKQRKESTVRYNQQCTLVENSTVVASSYRIKVKIRGLQATSHLSPSRKMAGGGPPAAHQLALQPSAASSSSNHKKASLTVNILSAYDLPSREPPVSVQVSIHSNNTPNNGTTTLTSVGTGPPAQRHKDRNSFKFDRATQPLVLSPSSGGAGLPDLYGATATIRVTYADPQRQPTLVAHYALNQLRIHETTWLILQLSDSDDDADMSLDDEDDDDDNGEVPPTLRLQMTLEGPYRTEIGWVVHALQEWFRLVDHCEGHLQALTSKVSRHIPRGISKMDPKYLLLAAAPVAALLVVSAPVLMGLVAVTLPLALPLLAGAAVALGFVLTLLGLGAASTRHGRRQIGGSVVNPVAHTLLSTTAGQRLVYQTGPRPNPVTVARAVLPRGIWGRLVVSLLIDAVGSASYLIPVAGEVVDVVWAPVQTILIMALYNDVAPHLKYVSFIEEILPLTDIVPSATIGWLAEFGVPLLLPQPAAAAATKSKSGVLTKRNRAAANNNGFAAASPPSTPVRSN